MKILMVCLGNICRSPLAEGIMLQKIKDNALDWEVDSAGTSGWHIGELPDSRSIETAKQHGLDITYQRSRQLKASDLNDFDLILAMDSSNYSNILRLATTTAQKEKVKLILNYAYPGQNRAVPDPYYDGGFEKVYQMLDLACAKLLESHTLLR
jgi:protein-tyrosine phosphatase